MSFSVSISLSVCVVHKFAAKWTRACKKREKSAHKHIICKMSYGEFIVRLLYNKLINKAHFSVRVYGSLPLSLRTIMSPTDQVAEKKHFQSAHICVLVSLEKWHCLTAQTTRRHKYAGRCMVFRTSFFMKRLTTYDYLSSRLLLCDEPLSLDATALI